MHGDSFLRERLGRQENPCRQKQRNADNVNQRRETEKSGGGGVEMGANAVARRRAALKNATSAFNPPARIKSARTQMKACKIIARIIPQILSGMSTFFLSFPSS